MFSWRCGDSGVFFFFSSRRRHTRFDCDWSSDVCSSDLQALDIGLHGVIFNGVDTREQALVAVKSMRYPQLKGSKYYEPNGTRGAGAANANWIWGISGEEYDRHADLWPLNPEGDLLAIAMIESVEGLQNLSAIASTPGVGALF